MTWGETATGQVYMKEETKEESPCFALTSIDLLCRPLPAITPFYQDESVTLYNADCAQILPFLEPCDLLLTDPPYGIGADKKKAHSSIRDNSDWDNADWDNATPPTWLLEMAISKAAQAIVWGGNYFGLPASRGWLVWNKPERNFSLADAELAWTNKDIAIRCFDCPRTNGKRFHPTQKPLALIKWCIGFAPDAKTILDPFAGSGTTLRAAKDLGLQAIGIERDERYCEIIVERLRQQTLGF